MKKNGYLRKSDKLTKVILMLLLYLSIKSLVKSCGTRFLCLLLNLHYYLNYVPFFISENISNASNSVSDSENNIKEKFLPLYNVKYFNN